MRGSSPSVAITAYIGSLQRALSCITGAILSANGRQPAAVPWQVVLNRGPMVPLHGGVLPLALRFDQQYVFIEDREAAARDRWTVSIIAYRYTIHEQVTSRELFAFHWHPEGGRIDFPHLHLGSRILSEQAFAGRHVPTGQIGVPDLLRFLIAELGVAPGRGDWEQVLAEAGAALGGR